jgi:hypothetical protein
MAAAEWQGACDLHTLLLACAAARWSLRRPNQVRKACVRRAVALTPLPGCCCCCCCRTGSSCSRSAELVPAPTAAEALWLRGAIASMALLSVAVLSSCAGRWSREELPAACGGAVAMSPCLLLAAAGA